MDNESKILQLWHYLKIQDDEILIVQYYNESIHADEYAIITKNNDNFKIQLEKQFPELSIRQPFHLFQRIGADGKHIIPSVEQLKREEEMDY